MDTRGEKILESLKEEIVSGPTLIRPYPSQIFNIRTDQPKDGMGTVLLQPDDSVEARKSEAQERLLESLNLTSTWKEFVYD